MKHLASRRKEFKDLIKFAAIPDGKAFKVFQISADRAFIALKIVLFRGLWSRFPLLILAGLIFDCRGSEFINERFGVVYFYWGLIKIDGIGFVCLITFPYFFWGFHLFLDFFEGFTRFSWQCIENDFISACLLVLYYRGLTSLDQHLFHFNTLLLYKWLLLWDRCCSYLGKSLFQRNDLWNSNFWWRKLFGWFLAELESLLDDGLELFPDEISLGLN